MEAKRFLKRYEEATKIASDLKKEYEKELAMLDTIKSPLGGDGLPHGSRISKTVEDKAIRLADKAMEWKMAELDALEERQAVFDLVMQTEGPAREVLINRYIELLSWEEICVIVGYEWTQTHFYHKEGLKQIEKMLNTE